MQPTLTVAELVRADERLKKENPLIKLPVLILHGTLDKATKPSGSHALSRHRRRLCRQDSETVRAVPFHDPLNDLDKKVVMADILAWLDARL